MIKSRKQMIEEFDNKTENEKLVECQALKNFVTVNGISKDYLIHVFKWLYSETVDEDNQ